MGRFPRIQVEGLLLHITIGCNNQEFYFQQSEDFQGLLRLMNELIEERKVRVYDYALMSNHTHWLLCQEGNTPISASLGWVWGEYAKWYNRKYQRRGHFWGYRYHTTIIEEDDHALICMRYIALNPIRAGIVLMPVDYAWSGYRHYAGVETNPLLQEHPVYTAMGRYPKERQERYRDFIERHIESGQNKRNRRISSSFVFGSTSFRRRINKLLPKSEKAHQ